MSVPDLKALREGDEDAWARAAGLLREVAERAAASKLAGALAGDAEDVAAEAVEAIVDKVKSDRRIEDFEEVKRLTVGIARNQAVSRLREHFAAKHGAGKVDSLDAHQQGEEISFAPPEQDSSFAEIDHRELADLLKQLQEKLKPEYRKVLHGVFVEGLTQKEIAAKQGLPIGTVSVYSKRGLECIRKCAERHPRLLKELKAFLR
jgi:RNA polymerase sigma factor (sigma-70 family)